VAELALAALDQSPALPRLGGMARPDGVPAGAATPTRFATRCGTNFAALVLPVGLLLGRFWRFAPTVYASAAVVVLSLALTMELWLALERSSRRVARVFLLPGLGLQRLTTREPALAETRVALRAVASVLERELQPHAA
jgi:uncharacterized protein YqhQ